MTDQQVAEGRRASQSQNKWKALKRLFARGRPPRRALNDEGEELNMTSGAVLRFMWGYWRRRPGKLAGMGGLMALAVIADSLLPAASGRLVETLARGRDAAGAEPAAMLALTAFIGFSVLFFIFRTGSMRFLVPFTTRNMTEMASEAFARVQSFSTDWHANSFAGATVRRITRGMWALDTLTDVFVMGILPPVIVITALSAQMAMRWPVLGAFMLLGAAVFVAMTALLVSLYLAPANRLSNDADSKLGAALADAVTCNAVVKAFGAEAHEEARFTEMAEDWRKKTARSWNRYINTWTLQSALLLALQVVLPGFVVLQWLAGNAGPGDVVFAITSFLIISGYLRTLGENMQMLQRGINEMDDLAHFATLRPTVADEAAAADFQPGPGDIRFENVTFGYANQPEVLYKDFSLRIKAGERVALVGPSGSGKSTFVKLVQRLYDVDGGRVLIDGQDISGVRQDSLRRSLALVPQDPALFHRTLAENIAYGRRDASMDAIVAAAKKARAHEFISALPQGYDTLVGERGVKLSGGERQRVAIARAFLADAPILILDEATSSLDSVTEAEIQAAMDDLVKGRTAIIIAHRLSTVRDADRILVFDKGRIVEEGRHGDLLAREGGRYRQLHLLQEAG